MNVLAPHNLRWKILSAPALLGCLAVLAAIASAPDLSAQSTAANRFLYLSVSDPLNRFVTGLDKDQFVIVGGGILHPVTSFSDTETPMSIAIISEAGIDETSMRGLLRSGDTLTVSRTLAEAVEHLSISNHVRKVLIIVKGTGGGSIPGGIFALNADASSLMKTVAEVRNQYVVGIFLVLRPGRLEVGVQSPLGLPELKANVMLGN